MSIDNEQQRSNTPDTTGAQPYIVTPEGSLGLLALGYRGIDLWRKKRKETKDNLSTPQKEHE